jgi:hypothetical protein
MKKLLFGIVLYCSSVNGQVSVFHPFPDSGAVWNCSYSTMCTFGMDNGWYSIVSGSDTTIQVQTYHRVHIPFIQTYPFGTCVLATSGYNGAFRNDMVNSRVYFVAPYDTSESLLYDFNWQAGDTLTGFFARYLLGQDTILSVDSVLVGTSYRKRWSINPFLPWSSYNYEIVDGIGSLFGMIVPIPSTQIDAPYFMLDCFSQNAIPVYPDSSDCDIISGIHEWKKNSRIINLAPNPFDEAGWLSSIMEWKHADLSIYDAYGNLVRKEVINGKGIWIKRLGLPDGIYIVQIITDTGSFTTKFILW